MPTTLNPDPSCDAPSVSIGFNCAGSEMGHLFYVEGISEASPGPFSNVQSISYWSGTEDASNPAIAWGFFFNDGGQLQNSTSTPLYFAWAVHDGNISTVPVPAAVWLLGSGLLSLLGLARRKR